ncbi:hypothetical protein [Planctomycetes bacterium K23_9]
MKRLALNSILIASSAAAITVPGSLQAANSFDVFNNPLRAETSSTENLRAEPAAPAIHSDDSLATSDAIPQVTYGVATAIPPASNKPPTYAAQQMLSARMVVTNQVDLKSDSVSNSDVDLVESDAPGALAIQAIDFPPAENQDALHSSQTMQNTLQSQSLRSTKTVLAMPPTVGRFVQDESVWLFVPDQASSAPTTQADGSLSIAEQASQLRVNPRNTFRRKSAVDQLRHATQNFVELLPTNPFRNETTPIDLPASNDTDEYFHSANTPATRSVLPEFGIEQAVVVNDLILQRALHTMRKAELSNQLAFHNSQPPTESRWEVSGALSLVDGKYQLSLHSAQPLHR